MSNKVLGGVKKRILFVVASGMLLITLVLVINFQDRNPEPDFSIRDIPSGGVDEECVFVDGGSGVELFPDPAPPPDVGDLKCPYCNIILVSIDTLRADHVGVYGYGRNTTPNIDSLASDALVFENAVSQSAWTLPAHASMFTGLLPSELGLIYYPPTVKLDSGFTTLAEILKGHGYSTVSYNGGGFVGNGFRLNQGFDVYESKGRRFEKNIDASIEWIRGNKGKRFFLFLHGYDAHRPYDVSREYNIFYDYNGGYDIISFCEPTAEDFVFKGGLLEGEELDFIVSQYDTEIRYVDILLGEFFRFLEEENLLNNTVVVITSDHGEEFFEHGSCDHIRSVYEELIRVPLIIRIPAVGGAKIKNQVPASAGILPAILDVINVTEDVDNENNFMRLLEEDPLTFDYVVSESGRVYKKKARYWASVRTGKWKIVAYREDDNEIWFELYNLENDPTERNNVVNDRPCVYKKLRDTMAAIGSGRKPREEEIDSETLEQLRSLGYLH